MDRDVIVDESIHATFSDCQVLFTFCRYFIPAVFRPPVTQDTINRCTSEHRRKELLVRRKCLYTPLPGCGYAVLHFIESAIWLLNCRTEIALSDDRFLEATLELDVAFKRARDLTDEEKEKLRKYYKWSAFATVPQHPDPFSEYDRYDWVNERRLGTKAWGPVYWALIHRYVYRLEDRLMEKAEDCDDKLYNCFTSLMWFVAFMDEVLPCSMCAYRYRNGKTKGIMYDALRDHVDFVPDAVEKFRDRPLTKAFYLAHREHSRELAHSSDYTLENLLEDMKRAPTK